MADAPGKEKSVLVTGGSSGIGAAFCRAAAGEGWHVWVGHASGSDRAAQLARDISAGGGWATPIALPLHETDRLRAAVSEIAGRGPLPCAAVLCGGPAPDVMSFLKLGPEQFRRQVECAIVGNHVLLAELWRSCFRAAGGGHVLAVLSAAQGIGAAPHMASYVAAKGGLEALLHAAAAELGRSGLRISLVRPGYVETPMLKAFHPLVLERARRQAPGGRFLDPGLVAQSMLRALRNPPPAGRASEIDLGQVGAAAS